MIRRFVIEPRALKDWRDFRYIMEKMGFSRGRVVVALPRRWAGQLLENLVGISDIERARFVTKLQSYKNDRIIASGLPYNPEMPWIDNVRRNTAEIDSDAVIVSSETRDKSPDVSYPTPVDVDEDFFCCSREIRCYNTPENLVAASETLLETSHFGIFVDPYCNILQNSYLIVLLGFFRKAQSVGRCREFSIFARSDRLPRAGEDAMQKVLDREIGITANGTSSVRVHWVQTTVGAQGFHARYFLTDKGGLRYDKGFATQPSPEIVDISLLDSDVHRQLLEVFDPNGKQLRICETWKWTSGDNT